MDDTNEACGIRSHDLSGWAKAFWVLLVAVIPWLGVFVYLIARGKPMAERGRHWALGEDRATHRHRQPEPTGRTPSAADELAKLAKLRDAGVITEDEFNVEKSKVLAKS